MSRACMISKKLKTYLQKYNIEVYKNIFEITNIKFNFIYHFLDGILNFMGHESDYYQICVVKSIFDFIFNNKELSNLFFIYKSEWLHNQLIGNTHSSQYKYRKHLESYILRYNNYKQNILLF